MAKAEDPKTKQLNVKKLQQDLRTIMDELSTTVGVDRYSPKMWMRLQTTTDYVVNAINAVRLRLTGKTCAEVAVELGLKKQQVAAYLAWNTMYQPEWPEQNRRRKQEELQEKMEKRCL
jgi:hypothetical protein